MSAEQPLQGSERQIHDAYANPVRGGDDGYRAQCWDCEWHGETRGSKHDAQVDALGHQHPIVEDDAIHMRDPLDLHLTLCDQRIADDTNIGTYSELLADSGAACWTCEGIAGSAAQ